MDLSKYTKALKLMTVIPFVVGLLSFVEAILPFKTIQTKVVSKKSDYRAKTATTTYTVNFEGINDQFTEEIYNILSRGHEVELKATYFNKQRRMVKTNNVEYENSTNEPLALYGFALVFLLSGLVWTKTGSLRSGPATILSFIILFAFIQLIRMF